MRALIHIASNIGIFAGFFAAGVAYEMGMKIAAVCMTIMTVYLLWFVQYAVKGRGGHEE